MTTKSERDRARQASIDAWCDQRDAAAVVLTQYLNDFGVCLGKFRKLVEPESRELWNRFNPEIENVDHPEVLYIECGHMATEAAWPKNVVMAKVRYGAFPWLATCLACVPKLDALRAYWMPLCDICHGSTLGECSLRAFQNANTALILHLCHGCAARFGNHQFERAWYTLDRTEYKEFFGAFLVAPLDGSNPRAEPPLHLQPVEFAALLGDDDE